MSPVRDWIEVRPRRAALLVASAVASCVLLTAGWTPTAGAAKPAHSCQILVVMDPVWTKAELQRVIAVARSTPHVVRVTFVSKKAALAAMRKKYPGLVQDMSSNPLSDTVQVVPDAPAAMRGIGVRLNAAHLGGVATIKVPPTLLGVSLC